MFFQFSWDKYKQGRLDHTLPFLMSLRTFTFNNHEENRARDNYIVYDGITYENALVTQTHKSREES